jgi:hypothetical protein
MDYDREEAVEILANAMAKLDPQSVYSLKSSAADSLFWEMAKAATTAKFQASAVQGSILLGHGDRQVTFEFKSGRIRMSPGVNGEADTIEDIEFDVANKMWRGTEFDAFRNPLPGTPKGHRSAVAVLAEHAAKVLLANR